MQPPFSPSSPAIAAQISDDYVNDSSIMQPGAAGSDQDQINSALGGYAPTEEQKAQERLELIEIYHRMRESVLDFEA